MSETPCRVPEGLYENGLQRDLFLPFIDRLRAACVVHELSSGTDYRQLARHAAGSIFTTHGGSDDPGAALRARFYRLADACRDEPAQASVPVAMGRKLSVPAASVCFGGAKGMNAMRDFGQHCIALFK